MGGLAFWVSPYMPYKYPFLPPPLNAIVLSLSAEGQLFLGCLSSSSEQAKILFLWPIALLCCFSYFALYSGGPEFIVLRCYFDPCGLQFFGRFFLIFFGKVWVLQSFYTFFFFFFFQRLFGTCPAPSQIHFPHPFGEILLLKQYTGFFEQWVLTTWHSLDLRLGAFGCKEARTSTCPSPFLG